MDFADQIKALGEKVSRLKNQIQTEEATKNALVMPFINALGYDIFNPLEVIPEFVADLGIKKGEKVDYCIQKDGKPIIIVECKWWGEDLNVHNSQLHRYFHVTHARFGILTNGITYRFYTDLEEPNKMDDKPFLEFTLADIKDNLLTELKKFHKSYFDEEEIFTTASELKYAREIRVIMSAQLSSPSEEFVRFFGSQIYKGRLSSKVIEQFTPIVKKSLNLLISDMISERLKTALENESRHGREETSKEALEEAIEDVKKEKENKIVTTEEELEAFYIVKTLLRNTIRSERVFHRDTMSYLAVILDNSNRKTICRIWLNTAQKYLGLFENGKEVRHPIENLEDLYNFSDRLVEEALKYPDPQLVN